MTWSYAFLYFIGIMYLIFNERLWSQIKSEITQGIETEITKKWRGVYDCMCEDEVQDLTQRDLNHKSEHVIVNFRAFEIYVFFGQIIATFLYMV